MKRRRTPHTSCRKGKRVRVQMRDGEIFVDKFLERTGNYVILESRGKVWAGDVMTFGLYRPSDGEAPCRKTT